MQNDLRSDPVSASSLPQWANETGTDVIASSRMLSLARELSFEMNSAARELGEPSWDGAVIQMQHYSVGSILPAQWAGELGIAHGRSAPVPYSSL